jgi:prepilin-type N-terminal cleavage/methylation domain-containing protein
MKLNKVNKLLTLRSGMSLFELIVVVIIVGVVYSLATFTLKKEKVIPLTMGVSSIKTTLLSLSAQSEIRMVCDLSCQECRLFDRDDKVLATLTLASETPVYRYGFNRFGELQRWGNAVVSHEGRLSGGCLEVNLSPDGRITPFILKSENTYYVYTPLGDAKPYRSTSEEAVRKFVFDESHYPMRGDSYYGSL